MTTTDVIYAEQVYVGLIHLSNAWAAERRISGEMDDEVFPEHELLQRLMIALRRRYGHVSNKIDPIFLEKKSKEGLLFKYKPL